MNNENVYSYKNFNMVAAYLTDRNLWPDFDKFLWEVAEKQQAKKIKESCSWCKARDWEWTTYCEDYKKYGRPRFANKKDPHAPVYDIT